MSGRSGSGRSDVTKGSETVGFIVEPSRPGGKWQCFVDVPNGNSKHVGWASDALAAREKVRRSAP